MNSHRTLRCCCAAVYAVFCCASLFAQAGDTRSTNPEDFTRVIEIVESGRQFPVRSPITGIDSQCVIHIRFDMNRMALPRALRPGAPARPAVNIRIEAYAIKGTSRTPIAPIHPYVDNFTPPSQAAQPAAQNTQAQSALETSKESISASSRGAQSDPPATQEPQARTAGSEQPASNADQADAPGDQSPQPGAGAATQAESRGVIVYHDKFFDPDHFAIVPDAEIALAGTAASSADSIELRIINLRTQQVLNLSLVPQTFGFHFKVSDTLMFVKRLGIGSAQRKAGISEFNFGPSPGVAYAGTYLARHNAFLRFVQPGAGIHILFTKWDNPAFDISTGQFVPGTKSSDIQTALGGQITLFTNVLQFGYGANLQVDQKRQYFSVGVSFVNLTSKITGLLSK
jgi:hypothetical protein